MATKGCVGMNFFISSSLPATSPSSSSSSSSNSNAATEMAHPKPNKNFIFEGFFSSNSEAKPTMKTLGPSERPSTT